MTANSKVVQFGPPPSGRHPRDTFHSLATKMLKDTLKEDPSRWWMVGTTLMSTAYPLEDIERLGYQQFGCTKCGSKKLPQTVGKCQQCFEPISTSDAGDKKPEEPPTLKPLKYAPWRAPKLPDHSDMIDVKTVTYYSRLLVGSYGWFDDHREIGELQLCKCPSHSRAREPLRGFFVRDGVTRITKSFTCESVSFNYYAPAVAEVMERGAKE